jgi:hypothetical protein
MATLFSATDGTLLGLATNFAEEQLRFSTQPVGTSNTLRFDEATNAALVTGLLSDWNSYKLLGTALTHKGVTVIIAAAGPDYQAQGIVQTAITTLRAGTATNAQVQQVLAVVLSKLRQNGII